MAVLGKIHENDPGFPSAMLLWVAGFVPLTLMMTNNCLAQGRPVPPRQPAPRIGKILPLQPLPLPAPPPVFAPLPPPGIPAVPVLPEPPVDPATITQLLQGELRFEITEKFLQKILNRTQQNSGAVQDFILGAQVSGQQTTLSNITINCLPSRQGARFNFEIQGTVQTSTTAYTPRATVAQQGNNQFNATKPVLFDGSKFLTKKAVLTVMPNQIVLGAQTRHSMMPLLGPLADQIALGTAMARTPQSNLIAGQKLIRRLQPQIDTQTDQNLKKANQFLKEKIWDRLEQLKLAPARRSAFSTDSKIYADFQFAKQAVTQAPAGESDINDESDINIAFHEQLLANLFARQNLAGKRISLNRLVDQSNIILQLVDPSFITNPNSLPVEVHLTYADKSPLTISFQNGQLEIVFRGTFQLQNLPATEMQRVRLTFTSKLEETDLVIQSDVIDVREELPDGTLVEPGFTQRAFVTQFETLLRPIHIKRKNVIPIPLSDACTTNITVTLKQIKMQSKWLRLFWNVTKQGAETTSPTPVVLPEFPNQTAPADSPPAEQSFPLKFPEQMIPSEETIPNKKAD